MNKELNELLDAALKSGKLFKVVFEKKDGSVREMLARTGVKKGLKGDGTIKPTWATNTNNVGVYEITRGINGRLGHGQYRAFNRERVISVKFAKQEVKHELV